MKVPWMPKTEIASRASEALGEYSALVGFSVRPPIPAEDVLERCLGLTLRFENLDKILGEDVLGATYVERKLVCINENLLDGPLEGRLIFTIAHEAGHWVLHRHLVEKAARTGAGRSEPIVCRTGLSKEPIEWQADYFAACLVMPEDEVKAAFRRAFGRERLRLENVESAFGAASLYVDPCVENWHFLASMAMEAGGFSNVSKQAMMLRLLDLGLVYNATGAPIGWRKRRPESRPMERSRA